MRALIFIEGGGDSKELHIECRRAFRILLEKSGFAGRMPRLVACGGRNAAYDDFSTAHENANARDYVALLVDSEDPVKNIGGTWAHLETRDKWLRPEGAGDDQVFFMTTCMETWIVADIQALETYFGSCLQKNALPALYKIENRTRQFVQNALVQATKSCDKKFKKGKRSFELVQHLNPERLKIKELPSFKRMLKILDQKL
jgi:hypothetical protein